MKSDWASKVHMPRSAKKLLGIVAITCAVCIVALTYLQSRASDFWAYGKLGLNDGTEQSPVYFVEVRGVGSQPTIAYIVRYADHTGIPRNYLDVSHSVSEQFQSRTRVVDRWRPECKLLVGRRVGETIEIPIDRATVQQWFQRPNARFGDFAGCDEFWDKFISPRIAGIKPSDVPEE